MERFELKELLKRKGVRPEFIEMPAIVEPIYKEVVDKNVSQVEGNDEIVANEDGTFKFGGKVVAPKEGGGAIITYGDTTIEVNTAGIATSYSDGGWMDFFSHTYRLEDGFVLHESGNNGTGTMSKTRGFDTGSWSILKAKGINYSNKPFNSSKDVRTTEINKEEILRQFDENAQSVMRNYPGTIEWYTQRREELVKTLDRETDPKYIQERRTQELEEEVERLTRRNRELMSSNEKLTSMLDKSLEFMSSVRNSPVGAIVFGKKIRNYEEGIRRLDKGRNDKDEQVK